MESKKIKKLEKEILKHKELYYKGVPEISDFEFDQLENELREIDPWNKLLETVGTPANLTKKIKHEKKMLSLNKTYKTEDLTSWMGENETISTFKIDGSSCSLVYSKGLLYQGKTRGDGSVGENILEKIKFLQNTPLELNQQIDIEVRGEVFCTEENFFHLSEKMLERGLEKPTSQRNIVAGLLGRKENVDLCKYLNFQAFELIDYPGIKTEVEKFKVLADMGFDTPDVIVHQSEESIKLRLNETKEFMSEGNYLIDGLVFSFNDLRLHDQLGETAHHPRYKMAFKFQGESKTTKLKSITWQVSRNGIVTPVGEVEPVELSSAKISRVTLHNYGMVKQHELKSGDIIEIVRSGEVIPKFLSVKEASKSKFEIPVNCPSCSEKLQVEDIRLVCINKKCPARIIEEILHFIRKIGIDDLSSKRLEEMINQGLIVDIPSLYNLTKEKLLSLDKVQEKLANKIIENINSSREVELAKLFAAIGISGVAQNRIEKIINAGYKTVKDFEKLTEEDLVQVESFAKKSAQDFLSSMKDKLPIIKKLLKKDVSIKKEAEGKSTKLNGFKFCITGSLSMKRSDIEKLIKENGGACVGSVSQNTNYLITNDIESTSSKFKKAQSLKIPILKEKDLLKLIKD